MRQAIVVISVIALCGGAGVARQSATTATVTGEVIDLVCYARNQATGMHHGRALECAYACIKWEGQPVGLLTKDGAVYQLAGGLVANNNEKIANYVAQMVTVTGEVSERDGLLTIAADDVRVAGSE